MSPHIYVMRSNALIQRIVSSLRSAHERIIFAMRIRDECAIATATMTTESAVCVLGYWTLAHTNGYLMECEGGTVIV